YDNAATLEDATDINVATGGTTSDINAQLAKAAHITGTVTDEAGAALANIIMRVVRYNGTEWEGVSATTTDGSGAYDIGGLPGGVYRIQFSDDRWPREYVAEFYDNATTLESAADINVVASETTGNINAQLAKA